MGCMWCKNEVASFDPRGYLFDHVLNAWKIEMEHEKLRDTVNMGQSDHK